MYINKATTMPKSEHTNLWIFVLLLLIGIIVGALSFYIVNKKFYSHPGLKEVHDTILLTDTVLSQHTFVKYITTTDTIVLYKKYTPEGDTIQDTISISMPIEHKEYADTIRTDSSEVALKINYSGWRAQIDTLQLSTHYLVTPEVVKQKKGWGPYVGVGLHVGYGATVVNNGIYAGPEVGISVQIGFGYKFK